jgi:uncharacterized protein (DUF2141 family)
MIKLAILSIVLLSFSQLLADGQGNNLTVKVIGIEKIKGQILIGIYDSKESFPLEDKAFTGAAIEVNSESIEYTFENIPNGTYCVALLHDENLNGFMDKGLFGIPKEGYAFSNNFFGTLSAPKFEQISFIVEKNEIIEIKLKY